MKSLRNFIQSLKENDVVIGLGAGTITALGKEILSLKDEVINVGN